MPTFIEESSPLALAGSTDREQLPVMPVIVIAPVQVFIKTVADAQNPDGDPQAYLESLVIDVTMACTPGTVATGSPSSRLGCSSGTLLHQAVPCPLPDKRTTWLDLKTPARPVRTRREPSRNA